MPELTRLAGEPLGIRVGTDRRHRIRTRTLDRERSGADLLTTPTRHRTRLPCQDRLVDEQAGRLREPPVGNELVAGTDFHEVTGNDVADMELAHAAVSHDPRDRGDERREAVERPFGPHLLRDPDPCVEDEDEEEEGIAPVRERQREHAERSQDHIEDGQCVRANDRSVRPRRRRGRDLATLNDAPTSFHLGQTQLPSGHEREATRKRPDRSLASRATDRATA